MIRLDEEGTVVETTDEAAQRFQMDTTSLLGRPLVAVVDEQDRSVVEETLSSLRRHTDSETCACRLGTEEGSWIEIEFVAPTGEQSTITGFVRERRDTGRGLATARDRFGHLFDLIQDAVVEIEIVDGRPIVRTVNAAFEDVFGYDPDAVLGGSLNEFILPEGHDEQAVDFDRRTAGGKANYAIVTRKTAQGLREFLYRGIPYDRPDGRQYGFAIYADVTEQKRARESLQVLHRALRHNLRNEMTIVHGMSEQIAAATDDPTVTDAADRIMECARRLTAVSQQASTAAEVVDRNSHRHPVDAAAAARSVAATYCERWPDATIETAGPDAATVLAGPELSRAIENLVENGLEHNEGVPTVRVVVEDGQETTISVRDDGPGIPEAERIAVFGGDDITQLRHGSGLGLWLAKWVVESAGGQIGYDRTDGWTTVSLSFPSATDGRDALGEVC
jgi:PAS domain S-box-containing protein